MSCIYGVAFIIASTWVGLLWLKRRRKSSEFKSSRIDTDFNTIDSMTEFSEGFVILLILLEVNENRF